MAVFVSSEYSIARYIKAALNNKLYSQLNGRFFSHMFRNSQEAGIAEL